MPSVLVTELSANQAPAIITGSRRHWYWWPKLSTLCTYHTVCWKVDNFQHFKKSRSKTRPHQNEQRSMPASELNIHGVHKSHSTNFLQCTIPWEILTKFWYILTFFQSAIYSINNHGAPRGLLPRFSRQRHPTAYLLHPSPPSAANWKPFCLAFRFLIWSCNCLSLVCNSWHSIAF